MNNLFGNNYQIAKTLFSVMALVSAATLTTQAATVDGFLGSIWQGNASDPLFGTVFNQISPENAGKWGSVEGTQGNFNWGSLDGMYALGKAKNLVVKQHTFVWGQQQPDWVNNGNAKVAVEAWMRAYMNRYGEQMDIADVVNEAQHAKPVYRDGLGGDGATGWDWVIWTFDMARKIDNEIKAAKAAASGQPQAPKARLIINDYNIFKSDSATNIYIEQCKLLKSRELLDGIGEQGHFLETADLALVRRNMDKISELNLPLYITELDIDEPDDAKHAQRFKEVFTLFWEHAKVRGVTVWGHNQGDIWRVNAYLKRSNGTERPALTWLRTYIDAHPLPGKGNLPPTAAAGNDRTVRLPASLTIDGIVTDDGAPGARLTQQWSKVSGPDRVDFATPASISTAMTFYTPGTYTIRLTSADGVSTAHDDVVVTVTGSAVNHPPTLVTPIANQNATVGKSFSFTFPAPTFADSDNDPLTYAATGMHAGITFNGATRTFSGTPTTASTSQVKVTANDGKGGTQSANFTITVEQNLLPSTTITSPADGEVVASATSLIVTATASDSDGSIARVELLVDGALAQTKTSAPFTWTIPALSEGSHTLQTRAVDNHDGKKLSSMVTITAQKPFIAKINFQPADAPQQPGWLVDSGLIYAARTNGKTYGWNVDVSAQTRDRNEPSAIDQMHDTLIRMQKDPTPNATWNIAVPNGNYEVRIIAGDSRFIGATLEKITVEGIVAINFTPTDAIRWADRTVSIRVNDGKITVAPEATSLNAKICGIEVQQVISSTF